MNWYSFSVENTIKKLKTDFKSGLSEREVILRRKKIGENQIPEKKLPSRIQIFFEQFKSPLIYILLLAGVVLLFLTKTKQDSIVIFAAVIISVIFGFWEENKVSNTIIKLKKILKTKTVVKREGFNKEIFQEELVPGDIILLKEGDKVPADVRLIETQDLRVSEAILTGEWLAAKKKNEVLPGNTPLADRDNMVYAGCTIERGEGKAVVVATGAETETGKIAQMLQETKEEKTPLQRKLLDFSKKITIVIIAICLLIFIAGTLRKGNTLEMFEASIAIAVGAIPEALPITMTVILAIGMEKILKKRGLVRRLSSVETLGSTSIICSDKTKTLTKGKMTLSEIFTISGSIFPDKTEINKNREPYESIFKIASLCNEGFIEYNNRKKIIIRGEDTDKALVSVGIKGGYKKEELEKQMPLIKRLPFSSDNQFQATLHKNPDKFLLYVSGSPEKILSVSKKVQTESGIIELDEKNINFFREKLNDFTERGHRVIALAKKEIQAKTEEKINLTKEINNLVLVGFVVLSDPLRGDVREAMRICRKAGLKSIIITGDHKKTAKNIAEEVGMKVKESEIIEGQELEKLSEKKFKKIVKKIKIYARAEPRHKMKIIDAWQEKGQVVAMTGDGVNDAPAIKSADIGIALGSGTDVAKEASDLVLLTDSFSVIVKAVEQGRVILDNIRKGIAYTLADSFTTAILVGFSTVVFGWPLPILPVQILWNNMVEDTFPNIAYAFEPKEKGVMGRGPTPQKSSLFTREMLFLTIGNVIFNFICIFYFWFFWQHLNLGLDYARTMIFGVISVDTGFVIFSYKNLKRNIWKINPFSNKVLNIAAIFTLLGFISVIYVPFLQNLFHTVTLGLKSWIFLIVNALLTVLFIEFIKWRFIVKKKK
ncbi:MAG: HAD-IC family P-type ATPase [Candidatus Pacebacteria bacterium]|nr:HAD-IC family P-type ATPase [Candidatus Paceibacterota bacterium]